MLSLALLAACGGRAHPDNADGGNGGTAPSDAGNSSLGGSGPLAGGDGASRAGTMSAGGSVQAGAASAGGNAQAGIANAGNDAQAGAANVGGSAYAGTTNGGGSAAGGTSGHGGSATGSADPALIAACSKTCDALSDCPDGGGAFSPTCKSDCPTSVAVSGADCTAASVDMLSCLTSALHDKSTICLGRFLQATQTCDTSVKAYQSCAATSSTPPPPLAPILCVHVSVANTDDGTPNCMEDDRCLNHLINNLRCIAAPDGRSNCSCFTRFSRFDTTVNDPTLLVCKNRFVECLATGKVEP